MSRLPALPVQVNVRPFSLYAAYLLKNWRSRNNRSPIDLAQSMCIPLTRLIATWKRVLLPGNHCSKCKKHIDMHANVLAFAIVFHYRVTDPNIGPKVIRQMTERFNKAHHRIESFRYRVRIGGVRMVITKRSKVLKLEFLNSQRLSRRLLLRGRTRNRIAAVFTDDCNA